MPIALVTAASRGVGRGVALALASSVTVFATRRSIDSADLPSSVVHIQCDHSRDADTAPAFQRIAEAREGLDLLVNSAWGGYERMTEDGQHTWPLPFWQQPSHWWGSMLDTGARSAFATAHTAPLMIARHHGLIVNISYGVAQKYIRIRLASASKVEARVHWNR